ncbi:MAG: heat-inducible transcription repressor HrcA [Armatimonadetes bacterium 55-13]|nr:heat-inducible transcription repressor HrcA [Armatimonadota bacterium]OJU63603.1 MAG: heat-inducible transcription repressor HrcA [Armatimonadetes bacterium 55-13]
MSELDSRKKSILRAVIIEYVTGAEPVGSELLVQKYSLGVKSATIRNELAEMSELGYLEQPHTSAGRIPSDQGYRFYVDQLLQTKEPDTVSRERLESVAEEGEALQTQLREMTRALSRLTHLLSVATTVRDVGITVKSALVSAIGPQQALLVLMMSNGHIENRLLECPAGLSLQDVGAANELLQMAIVGLSLRDLRRAKAPASRFAGASEKFHSAIWTQIRSIAKEMTRGLMITEGEEFMFGQPEFQRDLSSLAEFIDYLHNSDSFYEAVSGQPTAQTVTIGRENRHEKLHQMSVVRQSFYVGDQEAGVISLVGPTRMAYDAGIPLVSFTAKVLSESLTKYFG